MDLEGDRKRKKDKHRDDEYRKEKKSRRTRSRSRSRERNRDVGSRRKRRHSRSKSPRSVVKQEKPTDNAQRNVNDVKSEPPQRKAKETDMLNTRTGGAYIPPARLRMMQAQITDKSSMAYQRLAWEALKKSIHGHINKINVGNIGIIIKELLKENIVRGRGLLCRSVIQAQAASPTFTNVYAALVAAVNSRFPNIGELLLKRLVIQFKRGFKRNDKPICISSASFIAHLVNQRVAHEILALELLTLLVETPTDDSVEVSIAFLKECGQKLTEVSSKGVNAIFEMLRNILHEGQLDKRVQYMIEVMFQVWKDGFKDHPALIEELELVPEEEQFTHLLMLDDATDSQDILNVFKFDEKYEENEQKYKTLCKEILGSDAESGEEDESGESGSEESDEDDDKQAADKGVTIIDNTETNLVALRRTIYLTINSSLDFEECAHKLMKMQLKPGQEVELCHMFLDCCAEQRTYEKFYGLLAQRFCNINRIYIGPFEEIFKDSYSTAHRLDTNRLRNVSKFFAHLLFTDSISWEVLSCVKLNEEDTTSSSRIYIKILFQELAEYMGLKKLNDRLKDPTLHEAFLGVFPRDNPKNTRFSINFFTSIGLGGLTDELREHLKQMPKNVPPAITEIQVDSDSSSSSSSSSDSSTDSSSDSSSDSEDEGKKDKAKEKKKAKADKSKTSKNDEEHDKDSPKDRWGHDGFYDTYGKDARRQDSRPNNQRDSDNFTRPRDPDRRRNDRDYERHNEKSNDGRRHRDDNKNDYRDRYRENDRQDDSRYNRDNNRIEEDHRRNVSNADKYQDNYKRKDATIGADSRKQRDRVDKNYDDRRRLESSVDLDSRKQRDKEDRYQDKGRRNDGNEDADTRKQKEKERNRNKDEYRTDDNDGRSKRKERLERNDSNDEDNEKRQKSKSSKKQCNKSSDEETEVQDKNNHKGEKSRQKSDKARSGDKKRHKDKNDTDSSGDDAEQRDTKKYDKENKYKDDKKSRKDKEEESKETKRKKDKKRGDSEDGWDIRRAESVKKEEIGRYWDNHLKDTRSRETPERKTKNRSRRDS